jgi:hypothetical protein
MLKIILSLVLLFNVNSLFACWRLNGSFALDGETWKIHHKFKDNEEFFLTAHEFILTLSLVEKENKPLKLRYKINHKQGITLSLVSEGEEELHEKKSQDIYIKGGKGYPHSIITVKLKKI